jgi:hypothetical protein
MEGQPDINVYWWCCIFPDMAHQQNGRTRQYIDFRIARGVVEQTIIDILAIQALKQSQRGRGGYDPPSRIIPASY